MRDNKWVRLLADVTGLVNQRLLLQNEYLIAENRILRSHLLPRLLLSDPERSALAEIGKRLSRKHLQLFASVALPDTMLAWYRRLIVQKTTGQPTADRTFRCVVEELVRPQWECCIRSLPCQPAAESRLVAEAAEHEEQARPKLQLREKWKWHRTTTR
jgi:hypothetical protein